MKTGSIKTFFLDWLKSNLSNIFVVLIIIFACVFVFKEFQKLFETQKNFINYVEQNQKIRDEETNKILNAYEKERLDLKENLKIYEERMTQIEENYQQNLLELEQRRNIIANNIIVTSNGDSKKIAEAVASITGFHYEK